MLSSLEICAQNCQLSKWCWFPSLMKKQEEETFPKNKHNNTKSLKKNISVSTTTQQQVPLDYAPLHYFNTTTLHIVAQFQGHCSLKFPAGWTVKRSCLIYEVGQPKGAMQRKEASLGSAPSLSRPLPLILVLCEKPRIPSQKVLLEYNQAWTQRRFQTRGPNFLLNEPNFT